jgi:HlyD family secretion protein
MSFLRNRSNRLRLSGYAVLIAAVAVVLTLGLLSIYHSASASSSVARTVTAEIGTVASSVSASGNVSPSQTDTVDFQTSGTLSAVDVAVGDQVKAGQVLAKIDPTDADDALQSAQDALQVSETALADAESGGTSAQLDQNSATLMSSELQLTSDREQLSSDQTTLSKAQAELSSDEALGCPASTASQSATSSDDSQSSGDTGSGDTGSGDTGSGDSSDGTSGNESPDSKVTGPSPSTTTTTAANTKPSVTTGAASSLATSTVTLNATVDPGGLSTSYKFEYGPTDSYGYATASETISGSGEDAVSAQVSGLDADTGYIFRVVASNSLGSSTGLGVAFTTAESSCVTDQQSITTDQQTVQHDEGQISAQEQSIAATQAGDAPVSSTILQDESQVLSDQQTVTTDQQDVDETTLTSPMTGTVTAVNDQVGDTVSGGGSSSTSDSSDSSSSTGSTGSTGTSGSSGSSPDASASDSSSSDSSDSSGSGFITIDDLASLQVVAGFAEADATSIAVGQGATVTLAALPDTEVAGKVVAVSPTSTVVSDVVTYDVTIDMLGTPATVKDGMTADVSIIVSIARNVLELPNAAVTTLGTTSTVKLVQGTTTVTRDVTIGLVGESETQITSGLQAGDKVQEASTTSTGATTSSGATGGFGGFGGGGAGLGGGGFGG